MCCSSMGERDTMRADDAEVFGSGVLGFVFGAAIFAFLAAGGMHASWKQELVHIGVAEYNSVTGEWQYKEQYRNEQK